MGEQVEVDEEDVSDDFSGDDEDDDAERNQERKDQYNKIKEKMRKAGSKQKKISNDRMTVAVFKLMTNVVQIFGDVRRQRNIERDTRLTDF